MRTLIVDNDAGARRLLEIYLADCGPCESVASGKQAVERFEQACQAGVRYDLVCLDFLMPQMDGIEVIKHLRRIEHQRGIRHAERTRIIVATVLNRESDSLRAYIYGCDAYTTKPTHKQMILDEIRTLGLLDTSADPTESTER